MNSPTLVTSFVDFSRPAVSPITSCWSPGASSSVLDSVRASSA